MRGSISGSDTKLLSRIENSNTDSSTSAFTSSALAESYQHVTLILKQQQQLNQQQQRGNSSSHPYKNQTLASILQPHSSIRPRHSKDITANVANTINTFRSLPQSHETNAARNNINGFQWTLGMPAMLRDGAQLCPTS
jgi:hypothetical protein